MNPALALVLVLLAAAIVMFALNRPRMDAVALIMLTALPFTGVLTMNEALAGFSDSNIVLIAALFVIGDGLVRTGVAQLLGDWLLLRAGGNEARLIALLMLVVCALGATMSSTAVTAIFIPVALRIADSTESSPGRLMMPLSVAALISGMTTLIATAPNMVVSSELERQGTAGFSFFAFTPFGVPILFLGIGYMLIARRWLGSREPAATAADARPSLTDWIQKYQLADKEFRLRVPEGSPFVGKTLGDLQIRSSHGANILAIERAGRRKSLLSPTAQTELRGGDVLHVDLFAPNATISALIQEGSLEALPLSGAYFTDLAQDLGMAEVIIPAESDLIGKTVMSAGFRTRFGLTVVGLRRGKEAQARGYLQQPLQLGDTLLLIGPWKAIRRISAAERHLALVSLPAELDEVLPAPGKAVHAVLILLLVVGLMVSGLIPNVQAALIGCLLMGLFGCISLNSAYRAIDWKTLVLIVGMLPFSIALERTGGVTLAADGLIAATRNMGPHGVLATLFVLTAALGMFISNTATAVLMAPVAIAVAKEMGASPYPFAMIVALAASTAFMTPVSSPVNTLVVTPGNYTFWDFVRIGVPFAIIVMIFTVVTVPLLLPL